MSVTLPYPSMSFVPLDVLTAEEMNHMSANDQYLAGLFPLVGANIGAGQIDNDHLALRNTLNLDGDADADAYFRANRADTNVSIGFGVGSGGTNRGIFDMVRNRWAYKIDADGEHLTDDTRVLGGWYCSGRKQVTGTTTDLIPFKKANPYGIHIIASAECVSGTPSWFDIRAVDSNGGAVSATTSITKNGTYENRTDSVAIGYIPMNAIHVNGACVIDSIRSATGNYRSFVSNSIGGKPLQTWVGGARQNDNTQISAISCVASNSCNIYLEVWEQDEP